MTTRPVAITGAASGIGAATRALLESRGAAVIGVDLRDSEVTADLSTPDGRAAAVEQIGALAPEGLGGLIACAGIAGLTGVDSQLLVSVNYFGAVDLATGLRPLLTDASVVFLSSNSVTCQPGWFTDVATCCLSGDEAATRELAASQDAVQLYPATKAALAWWVRRNCVDWARDGIRLNAIAPGLIATPMTDALRDDPVLGVFADAYPSALERPGRPEEVAELLAFMVSPASSLMVGSVVFVDGGTDAMMHADMPQGS